MTVAIAQDEEFELTFPEDEREFLKQQYLSAESILEYGSGGSTVFAATKTNAKVLSIESDKAWTERLNEVLVKRGVDLDHARAEWIDIGKTKKWGYPQDHARWRHFPDYVLTPWEQGFDPDLVLIDGRFRRACLAATILLCRRETTVLFDDYASRATYQKVEEVLKPTEVVGRLARFVVKPGSFEDLPFATMIRWFFKLN